MRKSKAFGIVFICLLVWLLISVFSSTVAANTYNSYWISGADASCGYTQSELEDIIKSQHAGHMNTIYVDIKDESGEFCSESVINAVISKAHSANPKLAVAVRFACFNDAKAAEQFPDAVIIDNWLDPACPEVQEYLIDQLEKLVQTYYVDEVNLDFIRYPATSGDTPLPYTGGTFENPEGNKVTIITEFEKKAVDAIKAIDNTVTISTSVFGIACEGQAKHIGQDISELDDYVDFIMPMIYPSYYSLYDENHPYECVEREVTNALKITPSGNIKPWVQGFGPYTGDFSKLAMQIDAVRDTGATGAVIWWYCTMGSSSENWQQIALHQPENWQERPMRGVPENDVNAGCDEFDEINSDTWYKATHVGPGGTQFNPEHVDSSDGHLVLIVPKEKREGGEIFTTQPSGYGVYRAKIKSSPVPYTVQAFFTYKGPEPEGHNEIDIEFGLEENRRIVTFTTWVKMQKNPYLYELPYNPWEDYHEYGFDWYPDRVEFYAEDASGQLKKVWTSTEYIPDEPCPVRFNNWVWGWPSESPPLPPETSEMYVDWVKYGLPKVTLLSPTFTSPARAGAPDSPNKIDVTLEVKKGTVPITGLTNNDFNFLIGKKSATAILTDTSVPGKYEFDVTPPTQDDIDKYDLSISLTFGGCTIAEIEKEAVVYTTGNADVMLVVDCSGSMMGQKIVDAKTSAKQFIDYMRNGDKAGVVSFSSSAAYNYHLTTLDDAKKNQIKNSIDGIYAGGITAMGSGLRCGYNDFINYGDPTNVWAIVLLSDGYHNAGEHPNNVLPVIKFQNIIIYTIGLGSDVDKDLLEHIARETGGLYYYTPTSDQLKEIYESIVGKIIGWQTILKRSFTIFLNKIVHIIVPVDSGISEAMFSISWSGSDLDLVLYKPDETKVDPSFAATDPNIDYVEETTYEFYRVRYPDAGNWKMEVTAVNVPLEGEEFTAMVSGVSTLSLWSSTNKDQYNQGETVKTTVTLTENGFSVAEANVIAHITLPDNFNQSFILYDDGGHGDINPNDGVYANYFDNTLQIGDYKIEISATGLTPTGEQFSRVDQCTFKVVAGLSSITLTPDTWVQTAKQGDQIQSPFIVNDPAKIGELFPLDASTYAEYNGTHYLVYDESSIGGEPDYIIPAPPSSESLVASNGATADSAKISISPLVSTVQLSYNQVSKWVSLTATTLQTSTGDLIDASNIVIAPNIIQVPLGGSEEFYVSIQIPQDAVGSTYSGKIVATSITGSDSIDVEITVISNLPPVANANGPYTGVVGEPIILDGTGSYDSDGVIVSYEWDLDDDGEFDDAIGVTPTKTWDVHYSGVISLKVTDDEGATDIDSTTLTVEAAGDTIPPTIESVTLDAYTTIPDATIHVTVEATDNVDVTLVTCDGIPLVETGSVWEGDITAPSNPCDYTMTIRAEDAAENFDETTIPCSVVIPTGGLGVGISPRSATASAGDTVNYKIIVSSTENFDDTIHVYVSMDGLPDSYKLDMTAFEWREQDVKIEAGEEEELALAVTIPTGESGIKVFQIRAESTCWTSKAYSSALITLI